MVLQPPGIGDAARRIVRAEAEQRVAPAQLGPAGRRTVHAGDPELAREGGLRRSGLHHQIGRQNRGRPRP